MSDSRLKDLAEAPLGCLLLRYSWPALVSMTLNALYTIVDRVYIGQGCGQDAMAGLTLAFPVMMVFGAFGVFVGAGHAALISLKLGAGDRTACEKILGELVAFKLAFFFVLPPLVFAFLDPILRATGGSGVTPGALEQAKTYLRLVLFSHLFSHLAFGLSAAMRSEGGVLPSMMCMVAGFGANLMLDPIFIFTFKMGVAGAAWATNIAMFFSCLLAFWYYRPGHSVVRLRLGCVRFYREFAGRAAGIGLSPALQQLMGSLITVSMQMAFAKWATSREAATAQIASLGIFQMSVMFFLMPVLGVQQGLAPIMGFNWGARSYGRVRDALMLGFWITTACVATAAAANVLAPGVIARVFTDGKDVGFLSLVAGDLRLANCMLWCIGLNVVATTYFQSIGHPKTAILLSMMRQCLCLLPCIWLLPYLFEDHMFAIWVSHPISDVLAFLFTIPPFFSHARFLRRASRVASSRSREAVRSEDIPLRKRIAPWLSIFRLPNLPTAPGDALAGAAFLAAAFPEIFHACAPRALAAAAASLFLYMFGLADNDVAGAACDAQHSPHRPIPSGAISMRAAKSARAACLVLAIFAGAAASLPALWWCVALLLLGAILLYNRVKGSMLMGACRGLSMIAGGAALYVPGLARCSTVMYPGDPGVMFIFACAALLLAAGGWMLYIAAVTKLSEGEESASEGLGNRRYLLGLAAFAPLAAMVPVLACRMNLPDPRIAYSLLLLPVLGCLWTFITWCAAVGPLWCAHGPAERRAAVGRTIGALLYLQLGFILVAPEPAFLASAAILWGASRTIRRLAPGISGS